jgi:phosphatidylcholine synthase
VSGPGAAAGYLVHAYTASGVVCGWLALVATLGSDYRGALLWLVLATLIDATDGVLARRVDIARTAPRIDGAHLDDIVDYVTYVLVPGVIVWHARLLPPAIDEIVVAAVLLASACGFARTDAKTADHFFTGFPSYWNVVVVYLLALRTSPAFNAALLLALAALVFVPIRYVYPSRTPTLMAVTLPFGAVWSVLLLLVIWWLPDPPRWLVYGTLPFLAYYTLVSLWLTWHRRVDDRGGEGMGGMAG